jgi:hypothetical protein
MSLQIKFENVVRAVLTNLKTKPALDVLVLHDIVPDDPLSTTRVQTLDQFKLATFLVGL